MNNQNKDKDKSLMSGERQVCDKISKVEKWHLWRYNEVLKYVTKEDFILDLGTGCGYGAFIMAQKAKGIIGIDDCEAAIIYAKLHWQKENIQYRYGNIADMVLPQIEIIVAFEILEHIKDYKKLIDSMKKYAKKYIILSVPDISVPLSKSKFHWKHFTIQDIERLIYDEDDTWQIERMETPIFGKGKAIFAVIKRIQ